VCVLGLVACFVRARQHLAIFSPIATWPILQRDFIASAFVSTMVQLSLERLEFLHEKGRLNTRLRDETLQVSFAFDPEAGLSGCVIPCFPRDQAIAGMSGGRVDTRDWGKLLQCSGQLGLPSTAASARLTAEIALKIGSTPVLRPRKGRVIPVLTTSNSR
jgi:hypothetical protein